MADKYVVAAGGNWSAAGTWSLTDGGAGGAGAPSASENAFLSNQSGNLVVDAPATCLDLDFTKGTGYAGTFSGSSTLSIAGSITFKSGMTRTYTGNVTLTGSSKTITMNGITVAGQCSLNSGASYTLQDALTTSGTIFGNGGSLNTNGMSVSGVLSGWNGGTLTLGATTWTISATAGWTFNSGTLSAASSTINVTSGSFLGGGATYGTVNLIQNNGSTNQVTGANTYGSLSLTCGAFKTCGFTFAANQTVTGTLKILGNSAVNRLFILSSAPGVSRTITVATIDATSNNVDFMDIIIAGAAAPWATGSSLGDCLGNSGITFTPSQTQYWKTTTSGSKPWSTVGNWFLGTNGTGGAGRVPLPQDDVVFDASSIGAAGTTINPDMPRLGRSITTTGVLNSPAWSSSIVNDIFGSLTLSGFASAGGSTFTFRARSPVTITSLASQTLPYSWNGPGGTFTLQNAYTVTSGASSHTLSAGTLDANGFAISTPNRIVVSAGATLKLGSGTWFLTGTGQSNQVWSAAAGTIDASGGGTIKLTDATSGLKSFAGGGNTYNIIWLSGNGTGVYQFTGSNTFTQFKMDVSRSVQFTAGTTTTATDWQLGDGTSISSITAASHTLIKSGGGRVIARSATVSRSAATPANTFFAPSGTDGGNNSGWTFAQPFMPAWNRNANILIGSGAQA